MLEKNVDLPGCIDPKQILQVKYKRAPDMNDAEFGYIFNVCLNGLEKFTKQKISSLELFMDLHFTSDLKILAERLAKHAEISFSKQWVKTHIVNAKGEQGTLEYILSPAVVFEIQSDICKLRVAKISLNMSDVKVADLPFGPKWLPRAVNDRLITMGFNFVKFIDELGIVTNAVTPYMNAWLDQNRGLMGCDKTTPSSLTFFYDLNSNKSSFLWFPMPTFLGPKNFFLPAPKAYLE